MPPAPKIYTCVENQPLTDCVCVAVVMQASSGYRLAAKQRIALKAVTEFFQEPEHIGDTADRGQSQGMLLLVKTRQTDKSQVKFVFTAYLGKTNKQTKKKWFCHLKLFRHLVRLSGRRRLWLDSEQSPRRLEHIAGAPMRRSLAQSGLGVAGYAAGLNGVLPSHTCSSKCKLADGTTKTDG